MKEDLLHGNALDFPDELKQRMIRLRYALERFKARLITSLDEKLKGKVPVVMAASGGEK